MAKQKDIPKRPVLQHHSGKLPLQLMKVLFEKWLNIGFTETWLRKGHYHVGLHMVTCWGTIEYFVPNEGLLSLVALSFQLLIMFFRRQWERLKIIRMLLKLLWLLWYYKDTCWFPVYSIHLTCHQTQSILQVKCKGMHLVAIKWTFFVVLESNYLT